MINVLRQPDMGAQVAEELAAVGLFDDDDAFGAFQFGKELFLGRRQ